MEAEKQVSAVPVCPPDPPPIHKLREAQLADSTWGRILRGKEAGEKPATEEMGRASRSSRRLLQLWDKLLVHDGILCRQLEPPDGREPIIQFVILEELRAEVLADLHDGAMGGHLGMDKTLSRLKERFYWPGHYNDVQAIIMMCRTGVVAARSVRPVRTPPQKLGPH